MEYVTENWWCIRNETEHTGHGVHDLNSHLRALTATVERLQHGVKLGGDDMRAIALSLACVVGIIVD